jgi:hypothetical protein
MGRVRDRLANFRQHRLCRINIENKRMGKDGQQPINENFSIRNRQEENELELLRGKEEIQT